MYRFLIALLTLTAVVPGLAQSDKSAAIFSTKAGAIRGFDPVAYFTENKATEGSEEITFHWQGADWHFASEENKALFEANPEQYLPAYGGWCAYGWSRGYAAPVDPTAWRIVEGRLYLNYNAEVQALWSEDQATLIEAADKHYGANFPKE